MAKLTYKKAGVDIQAGEKVAKIARSLGKSFKKQGLASDIGLFAGLFRPDWKKFKDPLLVATTDGVGTKVKLAQILNRPQNIGQDLVAMNVNDLITCGARPLFFLDYIGCHKVELPIIKKILQSITAACKMAACALIGGETAEMPDIYGAGEYDLAGFAVGLVEKSKIINGRKIKAGDVLIGLASSGLHSNGYTLARQVLGQDLTSLNKKPLANSPTLGEILLTPTIIYSALIQELLKKFSPKGIAHITGGGIPGNLVRILPAGCQAVINKKSWEIPKIFQLIQKKGQISEEEMLKTFNLGIGLVIVVAQRDAKAISAWLDKKAQKYFIMGKIVRGPKEVKII